MVWCLLCEALCGKDNNAFRNIRNACVAQNELGWFEEQKGDPNLLFSMLRNYHIKAGVERSSGSQNKSRVFVAAHYKEEIKRQRALLFDGVSQYMNKVQYQVFMALPANGTLDAEDAGSKWEALFSAAGAMTDECGPTQKLRRRVAVRTQDLVINREAHERNKMIQMLDKEKKTRPTTISTPWNRECRGRQVSKVHAVSLWRSKRSRWQMPVGRAQQQEKGRVP